MPSGCSSSTTLLFTQSIGLYIHIVYTIPSLCDEMTSDLHRPGLQPLSHLKAGPTTSSSKSTARPASSAAQPSPQASSRPRISRNNLSREEQVDAASDKATTTLIRRVLCPQASSSSSLQELLPPLTSSNEVDRQLYALIAIIVKEFVYSWYSKITSDQIFVNELLQVIAHCTRALEQRLRQVDVAQLVLDEVPALVEAHITSYRLAKQQFSLSGLHTSTRTIYHALNPHPSLSPIPDPSHPETITQQRENELAYRQLLVHGTLAVLLPTEDLENTCLRTLVGDILADLILGSQVGGRVCEGRFLWEAITKLVDISQKSRDNERGTEDRLRKFGLIPSTEEEELQNSSWAYKSQQRVSAWIWGVLQYVYVTFIALRFVATGLFGVASGTPVTSSRETKGPPPTNATIAVNQRAVFDYRLFSMLSELLDVPRRMPWLGGLLALFQYLVLAGPGKLGDADSVLDRFLHETIQDYVLTPTLLPHLLLASRTALFPSNAPPPPPPPPAQGADSNRVAAQAQTQIPAPPTSPSAEEGAGSLTNANANASTPGKSGAPEMTALPTVSPDEETSSSAEIAVIKRQCAARLLALIPRSIARRFFGGGTSKNTTTNADTDGQGGITIPIEDNSNNNDPPYSDNGQSNNNDHDQMKNGHTSSPTSRITSTPTSSRDDDSQRQPQPHPHPKRHHQHAHQQAPLPTPPSDSSADQEKEEEEEEAFLTTAIENEFLDLLADEYCNKHLVYSILETLLGKLLPELRERSVGGLLEDRGVSLSIPSITGDGGGGDATTVSSS